MSDERYLRELQDYYFYEDVKRELAAAARIKAAQDPVKPRLATIDGLGAPAAPTSRLTPGVIFLFWQQHRPDLLEALDLDTVTELWSVVSRSFLGEDSPPPVGPQYFRSQTSIGDNVLDAFVIKYPVIFRGYERLEYENSPVFPYRGIEFEQTGWAVIIDEFCGWLEPLAAQYKLSGFPENRIPIVTQLKEKFGTLGISLSCIPGTILVDVRDRQAAASEASGRTCMTCGKPGVLRKGGWHHVACDACEAGAPQ